MSHSFFERLMGRRALLSEKISLFDALNLINNASGDVSIKEINSYEERFENGVADGQTVARYLASEISGCLGRFANCTHKVYAKPRNSVEEHNFSFSVYDEYNGKKFYIGFASADYVVQRSRFMAGGNGGGWNALSKQITANNNL